MKVVKHPSVEVRVPLKDIPVGAVFRSALSDDAEAEIFIRTARAQNGFVFVVNLSSGHCAEWVESCPVRPTSGYFTEEAPGAG